MMDGWINEVMDGERDFNSNKYLCNICIIIVIIAIYLTTLNGVHSKLYNSLKVLYVTFLFY